MPQPRKRQRTQVETEDIVAEFDLEISIRERLQRTTQQRIKWAQSLLDGLSSPAGHGSSLEYKNTALDAWNTVNDPITVLLDRDVPESTGSDALGSSQKPPERTSRSTTTEPLQASSRQRKPKFLYIRNTPQSSGIEVLILKCPGCLRTDFTSLQGILNHARLAHKLDWGTHDDCINACAVPNTQGLVIVEGVEVSGLRPNLQRLFESALGHGASGSSPLPIASVEPDRDHTIQLSEPSTQITKTLGHHVDTPALAPFLGKSARRRGIRRWDESDDVDIFGQTTKVLQRKVGRVLANRNDVFNEDIVDNFIPESASTSQVPDPDREDTPTLSPNFTHQPSTRFHFTVRITITDKSMSISADLRDKISDTHKWMIFVESPSYSLDITSILKALHVSKADHQPFPDRPFTFEPLTCSQPPFVVVGQSSQPFLAKIDLHFNGINDEDSQIHTLEHWVELDELGLAAPVTGDTQVVDLELDKRTRILPPAKDYLSIHSRSLWDKETVGSVHSDAANTSQSTPSELSALLQDILPKFPMTHKDIRSRSRVMISQIPYTVARSPAHFKGMILGRRKAIEYGRARAIRDAYNVQRQSRADSRGLRALRTVEVYDWLEKEGHLIRDKDQTAQLLSQRTNDNSSAEWCSFCGLRLDSLSALHNDGLCTTLDPEGNLPSSSQSIVPVSNAFPIIDISSIPKSERDSHRQPTLRPSLKQTNFLRLNPLDLVAVTDPRLTMGIFNVMASLRLASFIFKDTTDSPFPLDQLGPSNSTIQHRLAPAALLGVVVNRITNILLEGALKVYREDKMRVKRARVLPPDGSEAGGGQSSHGSQERIITPSHLIRGLQSFDTKATWAAEARLLYLCFSELGIPNAPS